MSGTPEQSQSVADLAEMGRLFDEHRERLLAMLKRRIDPRLQARLDPEDILQDAYLVAQRRWPSYCQSPTVSQYAWLYRIVLDCLIEQWRKSSRNCRDPRMEIGWPEESSVALGLGLIDTGTRPSEAARQRELEERMKKALDVLRPSDRALLWMRHFDQLSYREAAEILGITENATAVRYVRALERLRALWQQLESSDAGEA